MEPLAPAAPELSPDDILQRWGNPGGPIDEILKACRDQNFDFERQVQINRARYNWRMIRGDQFLAPGFTSTGNGREMLDYVSIDQLTGSDEVHGADVSFAYPINVLGGDLWKFVAVLGQSAPRVKAVADDIEDPQNIKQAKDANATLLDARIKCKWDAKQRTLPFHQYVTGPAFGLTQYVTDRQKYGETVEPAMDVEQIPQDDGSMLPVPAEGPPQVYPNGDVELHICSILEVTVPFRMRDLAEPGWLDYQFMENKWLLISRYERLAQYRNSDPPDEDLDAPATSAAEARDAVTNVSGTGVPRKSAEWRLRQTWADPHLFEAITDTTARETFKRVFRDGIKIVKVGSIPVQLQEEKKTDVWSVCKTGHGEHILDDPLCTDSVPIQRVLNDLANLAIETVLRSIAQTIVDQMLLDRETLSKKEAIPNEIIFTMSPMGQDISRMIAQIPPARVSDQLVPLFQLFRMLQQDITGIRPELTGGGQPSQTYREAKQRKDQALMQLKPQADEQSLFWEQVATNTVKLRARYGSGQIKHHEETAIGFESHVVDLAELSETGWHAEADDGIPMSYTEQSDRLYAILHEAKPEIQQSLSLLDPINLDVNLELLGLPNHHSTYENQKKKTTADIQELLRGQPVPGPDGQMQSSIPADEYDDHQFTAEFIRQWMVSPGGQDKKMQVPQGFENVRLMQEAHQKMSAPPSEPPVKAGLNVSAKMEMLPPAIVNEVLQGAGLSPLPPEAMIPPPQLGTPEAPGAEPAAEQGQPGQAETQENPLPPLPPIPAGEQEPPLGPLPPTVQ